MYWRLRDNALMQTLGYGNLTKSDELLAEQPTDPEVFLRAENISKKDPLQWSKFTQEEKDLIIKCRHKLK